MLSAALRVIARAAAIQVEEAAAASARPVVGSKGKQRAPWVEDSLPANSTASSASQGRRRAVAETRHRDGHALHEATDPNAAGPSSRLYVSSTSESSTIIEDAVSKDGLLSVHEAPTRSVSPDVSPRTERSNDEQTVPTTAARHVEALAPESKLDTPDPSPNLIEDLRSRPATVASDTGASRATSILPPEAPSSRSSAASGITHAGERPTDHVTETEEEESPVLLRASKVPSSRLGRLFHYGSLAASLSLGAASESFRRTTGGASSGSVFMSDANVRRLVASLSRMRGAALKLGQFMSIQDNHMLPPEIERVLQQVQAHADYMPDWQMEKVMRAELGNDWQTLFSSFDRTPVASASIGQVHRAVLASTNTPVAVKVQFPGIADSISSDLGNLAMLLRSSALLPKGMFLQNTIAVMRGELADECDYVLEAAAARRFRDYLAEDAFFVVPKAMDEASTGKVLTLEWIPGKPLSRMKNMSQATRDKIGTNILRLCLQELFHFRFMQTDPNWANFLYDASREKLGLIDFGASREYSKGFMDGWYRLLSAAIRGDKEPMTEESLHLGYLTGEENDMMLEAHLESMRIIGSPFRHQGPYPFANQTITEGVRSLIPVMLQHRLTPPPKETYSLNRKLSGAFLMCAKLGANVDCQKLWEDYVGDYETRTANTSHEQSTLA